MVFDTDEHVRADTTLERLAKLRPAFKGDGSVTAGNSSGINDAAAAVVLMEASEAQQRGLKPLGRLVAYAYSAIDTAPSCHQITACLFTKDPAGRSNEHQIQCHKNHLFAS